MKTQLDHTAHVAKGAGARSNTLEKIVKNIAPKVAELSKQQNVQKEQVKDAKATARAASCKVEALGQSRREDAQKIIALEYKAEALGQSRREDAQKIIALEHQVAEAQALAMKNAERLDADARDRAMKALLADND